MGGHASLGTCSVAQPQDDSYHGELRTGCITWGVQGYELARVSVSKMPSYRAIVWERYVVTINPAYAMRELKLEPVFTLDIRNRLGAVIKGTYKPYAIETLINPSYQEALRAIRDIKEARKPTAFDIEWIAKETACIGFANDPHQISLY